MNQQWQTVCNYEQLKYNIGVCVKIEDKQIAIFRVPSEQGEQYYAVDNVDPFSQASVLSRGLIGEQKGNYFIASPIYKQRFNLKDGSCLDDITKSLQVFPIRDYDGKIQVAV